MVKLSVEMIAKLGPGFNKRRPDETVDHYLSRLTHIYLQEKHIDGIDSIPICKNLTVIYLYDNKIGKLENFEFAPNLTHLYLQNNRIKRIENLSHLTKLTKLHLGGNCLKMVEGLENMNELVELSIENQELPPGERLIFDPRCLMTLKNSLRILNISGNKMDSLGEIGSLVNLELLDASRNSLNDMKEMSVMLKCWPHLVDLNLSGNPLCVKNKYRERIIVLAPNVKTLDGKEIQDMSRQFLQNWKLSKEMMNANQIQQQQQQMHHLLERNYESNEYNAAAASLNLTQVEMNKLNAMPTYIMPEQRKQLTSSHSSKLRAGNGYLTHQSPERKHMNGMNSGRLGLPSASAKSSVKSDYDSGSYNGLNSLSTTGLALNSNKIKHKAASTKKLADIY